MDEEREREEGGTKKRCRECRVEEKRDRGRIGKAEWWEWGAQGLDCDGPAGPQDEARLFTPGKKKPLEATVVEAR